MKFFSKMGIQVVVLNNIPSTIYLNAIKNHKFMICPDGNAIGCECHRDWEVLYMRRVPIVVRSEYLEKIYNTIEKQHNKIFAHFWISAFFDSLFYQKKYFCVQKHTRPKHKR